MQDLLWIAATIAFFALSIGYVHFCDRRNSDMTANGWFQIFLFLVLVFLVTKPVGIFLTKVFNRERTFLDPILRPLERLLYRVTGVDENHEMRWTEYAISMLLFSAVSMIVLYLMERLQAHLPFNPQRLAGVNPP